MNKWCGISVFTGLALMAAACQKSGKNTPFPQISLTGITNTPLRAGNAEDTAFIYFDFEDGDGDLGISSTSIANTSKIYLVDSRSNDSLVYDFPDIDPSVVDPDNGLKGAFTVKVQAFLLNIRTDSVHQFKGDTLSFTAHVTDNAGNESNRVITPSLILTP